MSRLPPLPDSLRYLVPIQKRFASLSRKELPEDMDPSIFQSVFRHRVDGLTLDQAKKILQSDQAELERWLDKSGRQNNPFHFIMGFLLIASELPEKLLETSIEQTDPPKVHMKFPPESRTREQGQGWKVGWRGWSIFVLPCDKKAFDAEIESFRNPVEQYANLIAVSLTPIDLGMVSGFKKITVIAELGSKNVQYALKAPGGYATATVWKKGIAWEDTALDQYFSTIRLT